MSKSRRGVIVAVVGLGLAASYTCTGQDAARDKVRDSSQVVEGNTRFALDLYGQLRKQDGNLFFSPFSLSTALAMTYAGARGETAQQMARVLHFNLPPERLHATLAKLLRELEVGHGAPGFELHIANALWMQEKYKFLPEFLAVGRDQYRAGLETVDFASAAEQARETINAWVADRTSGKIKDLVPPGHLSALTRLVLTNAIYFRAAWLVPFDKQQTHTGPFTLPDRKKVEVPLMQQKGEFFRYLEQANLQILELPYGGESKSMLVLLPRNPDGLPALEKKLDAKTLAGWLDKLSHRNVEVTLPRFTLTCAFSLNDALAALGMRDAFDDSGAADFSGVDGNRDMYLGAVLHKAFVDVNEEGSEAAAATGVAFGGIDEPEKPAVFRADHPFLFLIRDDRSGSVLFLGRVTNPK